MTERLLGHISELICGGLKGDPCSVFGNNI